MVLARPYTVRRIQNRQPLREPFVPAVIVEPAGLGYGRRTEKVRIFMQHRAGGITSGAENAVCRIIEGLALLGGLNPLLLRDGIVVD